MRTYRARAEWDPSGWWIVSLDGVPGAITQCRYLDEAPASVADAIAQVTGGDEDTVIVDVEPVLDATLSLLATGAREARIEAEDMVHQAQELTHRVVGILRHCGFSHRDIAALVGITDQEAHELAGQVTEPEARGDPD